MKEFPTHAQKSLIFNQEPQKMMDI
uniref:Uncharacterized protein n=1 Tax=Rhizophora mucronata TaxID=61149 RepID=A0A2P2PEB5_RHIMU